MKTPSDAKRLETAAKVAALTLANAMIFQEQLALSNPAVEPLRTILKSNDIVTSFAKHWDFICKTINYVPIFSIARDILDSLPSGPGLDSAIRHLASQSLSISARRAALRHDLMGRIYHWLLHDAKYLGTYYTSVAAATLLLKITLAPKRWATDWSDIESIRKERFADLACGTGTLLMAASQAVTDNFIKASAQKAIKIDKNTLRDLHQTLMEDVLHGYDVLPSALHLTAATLGLLAPEIAFKKMRLYTLPIGKDESGDIRLGSIEYLTDDEVLSQLDLMGGKSHDTAAVTGEGLKLSKAPVPPLSLCVMNPPFVRSVGGNLLFGSQTRDRKEMQKELAKRLKPKDGLEVLANSTAGLGSVFCAVGDRRLGPGGTLSLVIPAAVTTGIAWTKTRTLIDRGYQLEYLIASHDAERWAFSENTDLSEVLVVAGDKHSHSAPQDSGSAHATAIFVSLWRNPRTIVEAQATAEALLLTEPAPIGDPSKPAEGVASIVVGGRKVGEALSIPLTDVQGVPWMGAAFAHTELTRAAWYLRKSILAIPGQAVTSVALRPLGELISIGPDRRDVYDAFAESTQVTPYAAFWSHDAESVTHIKVVPNRWLSALSSARKARKLRSADHVWKGAGRLMLAERMWLATQRMVAVHMDEPGLSNVWWPARAISGDTRHEKALALWLNSTLGVLILCAHRTPTRGPWVQFKKPSLGAIPALDVLSLTESQLEKLSKEYDSLGALLFLPLSEMQKDPVRRSIDETFASVLGLSDVAALRVMLSHEPIVSGKPLVLTDVDVADKSIDQLALF